jgi:RNA polymerase sigma factor (sigma-70 family)
MTDPRSIVPTLQEARRRFLTLVADVRPDLHRYCARMTGSVTDAEDIVQETLARAYYALSEAEELPPLRGWLFQIAHNRALDYLRRYERRMSEPLDGVLDTAIDVAADAEETLARDEATRAAISRFSELVPIQRSCVILKDVLGHSVDEIAAILDVTVPAVKAALHRGRVRLRELSESKPRDQMAVVRQSSPVIARYATLFNAREWDAVRAMLADDVRLDLVSRSQRVGKRQVAVYFTNYGLVQDWQLQPAWLEGREVLAVFRDTKDTQASYFIEVSLRDGQVTAIRDFRYVDYIARDAEIELLELPRGP